MTMHDSRDETTGGDASLEHVAGELTAELARRAAVQEALAGGEPVPLPSELAARIVASGERMVGGGRPTPRATVVSSAVWPGRLGWLLAAAAMVAWLVVPSPLAGPRAPSPSLAVSPPAPASPAALRDSLLDAAGVLRVRWAPTQDPAGLRAGGEVLWDARAQRGVMQFTGLAPNDPRVAQYQLWIIDAERDARYPVDGGVFDVASDGEVLVRIAARLPVGRPTLFAVTLERPGGVVVSTRERLVLAAGVDG